MIRPAILLVISAVAAAALGQDRALPPEEAAATIKLPPGFKATLFAGEPAIVQPISFTFDDRGRVWVVECLSYPTWKPESKGNDRVTILEDTDGDGRHDKRTVFLDDGVNLTGIEVGFGGVWLTSAPNFIFIPDADGDDKPDGAAKVLLDGFTLDAKHNIVGNLAWGPDGWLYGCHGITAPSLVGKPGTPAEKRQKVSCGVWRYHPVRNEFEVYANGTTNPWGLDWDERGQLFTTNCVIKHIFHVVPGAHFVRMFGQDPNPYTFGLMESCADHIHWAGGHWTNARGGPTNHDAGGGHAHSGCMIYLGDNWPDEYRGNAFLLNIHGQRLNRDVLERKGSGYVAKHGTDFGFSQDPWFRGLHCKYGPDGGVYVSDWSDTGECHDAKEEQCDKTGGRIFKIVYGQPSRPPPDLSILSDAELWALQSHRNEWRARHARRILQERAASGRLAPKSPPLIANLMVEPAEFRGLKSELAINRLRWLLTWHVTGQLDEAALRGLLSEALNEEVRAKAAILLAESHATSPTCVAALARAAKEEREQFVRLHIAAAAQRIDPKYRWPIIEALVAHFEDNFNPYLPLMYWYALEPLVAADVKRAAELFPKIEDPLVRQFLVRRVIAADDERQDQKEHWPTLNQLLSGLLPPGWPDEQRLKLRLPPLLKQIQAAEKIAWVDVFRGLNAAYAGRRNLTPPPIWPHVLDLLHQSRSQELHEQLLALQLIFGNAEAINEQLKLAKDDFAPAEGRMKALKRLTDIGHPWYSEVLIDAVTEKTFRAYAIRCLAAYDDRRIPRDLLELYPILTAGEKQDAIQTLTARPSYALALLGAIENGKVPRRDVSALVIRELQSLGDKQVTDRLAAVWGPVRAASADKKERAEEFKQRLSADALKKADLPHGRAIFAKNCASCHKLFGEGSKVGPELTGSQRHNLDYVLDNVLDPSAIVPREYKANVFRLTDGRVVQGVILEELPQTVTVQTTNDTVRFATAEIESRRESSVSMMPEGLFDRLANDEVRDLVAYLASPQQVPLPADSK
jgi:putative membrane-bound dehydrogenase-like protein